MIKPLIEFREDVLKLHTLYLEKRDSLTDEERDVFCRYFAAISSPMMVVDGEIDLDSILSMWPPIKPV